MSDHEMLTMHALLVLWGVFAWYLGLIQAFASVALSQKTYHFSPQTKICEFLVAILAGLPFLKDLSHAAHPIDQDQAVAHAWHQPGWADASGVSRTLHDLTQPEAEQISARLEGVSQPFLDREVTLALQQAGRLVLDIDLTGRPVSNTSTTYPGAAFGYMGDAVHLGYQAALVSMHSPTYGRFWVGVRHYPGDTQGHSAFPALIAAAERRLGVRPVRRIALLEQRLVMVQAEVAHRRATVIQQEARLQQQLHQRERMRQQMAEQTALVDKLTMLYQRRSRVERPYSTLAGARRKLVVVQKRLERRDAQVVRAQHQTDRLQHGLAEQTARCTGLEDRLTAFRRDNAENPNPIPMEVRLDAGFGTGEDLALAIEMGYELYTKPYNDDVTDRLRQQVSAETVWTRVGANAEMTSWPPRLIGGCPYPVAVALERFQIGKQQQHSTLVHFGDDPVLDDLTGWFGHYNGRQIIEAGIKEEKQVFQIRHLKVRSGPALYLQEQLTIFASNFVRWAALWLASCIRATSGSDGSWPEGVKDQVVNLAHTSAWVSWLADGCVIRFTEHSVYVGREMMTGAWAHQLALPLQKSRVFGASKPE